MSFEGADPPTQTRCVTVEYLDELHAKAARLRELEDEVGRMVEEVKRLASERPDDLTLAPSLIHLIREEPPCT